MGAGLQMSHMLTAACLASTPVSPEDCRMLAEAASHDTIGPGDGGWGDKGRSLQVGVQAIP